MLNDKSGIVSLHIMLSTVVLVIAAILIKMTWDLSASTWMTIGLDVLIAGGAGFLVYLLFRHMD
jgi:lipoprotein signal peptidase